MDVSALLRSENRCLQRFLDLSERFLAEAEAGDFSRLDAFHDGRAAILKALDLYGRKLAEAVALLPRERRTEELKASARAALASKEKLLRSILLVDARIVDRIEEQRLAVSRAIANNRKSRATVEKFKSRWVTEGGEEIDKKL